MMQTEKLVVETEHHPVWMVRRAQELNAATKAPMSETRDAQLLALVQPSTDARYLLDAKFASTLFLTDGVSVLPVDELKDALQAENADELFIAGRADHANKVLLLWRADLGHKPLIVPFSTFLKSGDGVAADFAQLSITDGGQTIALGDYEAAADAVLYEHDAEIRARLKKRRIAQDKGFGPSLRRLRLLRGLTQADFEPEISRKQIARLEAASSKRPRRATLESLAKKLRVAADDIATY
jgi:hypothetical protein